MDLNVAAFNHLKLRRFKNFVLGATETNNDLWVGNENVKSQVAKKGNVGIVSKHISYAVS